MEHPFFLSVSHQRFLCKTDVGPLSCLMKNTSTATTCVNDDPGNGNLSLRENLECMMTKLVDHFRGRDNAGDVKSISL